MVHRLGDDYRPLGQPDAPPKVPEHWWRHDALMEAFALAALIVEDKVKDKKVIRVPQRRTKKKTPSGKLLGPDGKPVSS